MDEIDHIIKATNIYLALKDRHLRYIYCSESMAEGLDLTSPSDIIGKTDYDLFDSETARLYQAGDRCVLNGGIYKNQPEIQNFPQKCLDILTSKA